MIAVELLERVIGQHDRIGLVGDLKNKTVAPANRSRRRHHDLTAVDRLVERGALGLVDAVTEGGIHHDCQLIFRTLVGERVYCLAQLSEAGKRSSLGGNVGTIDDDVSTSATHDIAQSIT